MRIGISTSVIQRGQGGVGQYVFALLRALKGVGAGQEFVLFVLQEDLPLFGGLGEAMEFVGVPEVFRSPGRNILWHQLWLPRESWQRRLDVVHVPSYRRMVWRSPIPRVATIHDLAPFRVAGKYDWLRMFYGRRVARVLARRQEEIIAVSQTTARDIERFFGIAQRRLTVIPNGLDHERFCVGDGEVARAQVASEYGVKRPFFLYVARLEHPAKNHVRLVEAFELFRVMTGAKWELVFAGRDWTGAEIIHEAISHSGARGAIRCLGFVPEAALPQLYRAAEAFVYPSLYEGFGMPPTEAMACGCPVICSARGALEEITGGAALRIEPDDAEAMALTLARIQREGELRQKLRQAGLARARIFDWRRTAEQTLEVYERAARRAARD